MKVARLRRSEYRALERLETQGRTFPMRGESRLFFRMMKRGLVFISVVSDGRICSTILGRDSLKAHPANWGAWSEPPLNCHPCPRTERP